MDKDKKGVDNMDLSGLIKWANEHGYPIKKHNHPKTRASWYK